MTPLTKPCTSCCVTRPLGPLPLTLVRSTPSSRANFRMLGLACGLKVADSNTGSNGTGAGGAISAGVGTVAGAIATGAGAAAALDALGALGTATAKAGSPPPVSSSKSNRLPSHTLSPTFIFNSLTTPAAGEGISMVALSDSTEISDCSGFTTSPTLTRTSTTSTSLKSPMSGTCTSLIPAIYFPCLMLRRRYIAVASAGARAAPPTSK